MWYLPAGDFEQPAANTRTNSRNRYAVFLRGIDVAMMFAHSQEGPPKKHVVAPSRTPIVIGRMAASQRSIARAVARNQRPARFRGDSRSGVPTLYCSRSRRNWSGRATSSSDEALDSADSISWAAR